MRVGVEMSGAGYLVQVGLCEFFRQRTEVVIDTSDRRNLADLGTAHPLHGQNLVRRVRVDDARNQDVRELWKESTATAHELHF